MTATLMPLMITRLWNTAGTVPLAGGKVYTYEAGTSTPKTSYTDATAVTANSNPVILDSTGSASIWISGNYRVNVLDSADVQQPNYPVDNVADFHTIDNITATSTTSLSISTTMATKVFTTQTDKFFTIGLPVFIVANGSITNNMYGQVYDYTGTQLTVAVSSGAGSGTFSNWTISLSGPPGPTGSTGGSGAGTGDMLGASNLAVGAGGVADAAASRTNLGLGNSAVLDVGTSATNVVQLDGSAHLPAVDGSALTNLNASAITSGTIDAAHLPALTVPTTLGAIGTYVLATRFNAGVTTAGNTTSGASLYYVQSTTAVVGASLSGTWKCMGYDAGSGSGGPFLPCLWLRTA